MPLPLQRARADVQHEIGRVLVVGNREAHAVEVGQHLLGGAHIGRNTALENKWGAGIRQLAALLEGQHFR